MGKLTIEGRASREYPFDRMVIAVTFCAVESTSAAALRKVTKQSEEFLAHLDAMGLPPESLQISTDSVREQSYSGKREFHAKRKFEIRSKFDMKLTNRIRELVQKNEYDAFVETEYQHSDPEQIKRELLQLAFNDSKQKASDIAAMMGQRIAGIKSVTVGDSIPDIDLCAAPCGGVYEDLTAVLSNRVGAPVETESERVEVIWLIE